jgi:aminoglycoside 2''-phosphotransferase
LIRREFPDFVFKRVTSVRAGENHTAIILDDAWVFRFPKSDAYRLAFPRQVHFLDRLAPLSPLRIPRYEYVSKDESFGGYKIVKGRELTTKRFKRLPKKVQKHVVKTLADFLRVLHKLPTSYLQEPKPEEGYWDPDHVWKYTERYQKSRRAVIKKRVSRNLLEQIDAFFPGFEELVAPVKRITHGDLRDAHILFEKKEVRGIIDFSDAYVADPAYDFAYFWSWGHDWFYTLLDQYGLADPGLPERSFWHYLRFEIDNLFYAIRNGDTEECTRVTRILEEHLPNLLGSSR